MCLDENLRVRLIVVNCFLLLLHHQIVDVFFCLYRQTDPDGTLMEFEEDSRIPNFNAPTEERMEKVKEMMQHAWKGYRQCSWGANEVRPWKCAPYTDGVFGAAPLGATIVDAADTLLLMELRDEYEQARAWIRDEFNISKQSGQLVFETTIRFLGGLLSLHALTNESFYLTKALSVGEHLVPHFDRKSGFPSNILAEFGSIHLEFVQLSRASNISFYEKMAYHIRDRMEWAQTTFGLYSTEYHTLFGLHASARFTLADGGDSFYEYLIKSWLQSNRTDAQARRMYRKTSKAIKLWSTGKVRSSLFRLVNKSKTNLTYLAEVHHLRISTHMSHLSCFAVGMFALEAQYENEPSEKTYRDWVWDAVLAIDRYCRRPFGFVGFRNVYKKSEGIIDRLETFFLAETLKYAFLTFAPASILPLDHWVFNTEAHPLPVILSQSSVA